MMRWTQKQSLLAKNATYAICVERYNTLASVIFLILKKINVSRNPIKSLRNETIFIKCYCICSSATIVCFMGSVLAEELKKQKEEYNKMENIMAEKLADKEKERHKLKCENVKLRHEIKQFNESRRPWERKLKIEE